MPSYVYDVVGADGRGQRGTLDAETLQAATEKLKKDGKTIVSLGEAGALNKSVSISLFNRKPSPRDMAVYCRQFTSILNAGVPVINALEMLGSQTENKRLRAAILACKTDIEKGESLAGAMKKHTDVFSDIFITMTEAGEASGSLPTSLTRMAEQYEKSAALQAVVKKASIYPIIVLLVAIGVIFAMMIFVIPTFQGMFEEIGTELPGITKAVIAFSNFVRNRWYLLIAIVVGLVLFNRSFGRTPAGKHFFGAVRRKLPLLGKLTDKTASATMARTLSTLLAAGIPMIDALDITSRVMTNVFFKESLEHAHDSVALGVPLSEALNQDGVFPPLVYHMISIGESTGDLDKMLNNLATYYEEEVQQATQQVMAALEPLIIVLLAGIVGIIVFACIMPMATMYSALDKA